MLIGGRCLKLLFIVVLFSGCQLQDKRLFKTENRKGIPSTFLAEHLELGPTPTPPPEPTPDPTVTPKTPKTNPTLIRTKPGAGFKITGRLVIHHISSNWISVMGDYNDFVLDRLATEYGDYFIKREQQFPAGGWQFDNPYMDGLNEILADYRPTIKSNFEDPSFFDLRDGANQPIGISQNAYWSNAIGRFYLKSPSGALETLAKNAMVEDVAYLKLSTPLVEGGSYSLTTRNGERVNFVYHEKQLISHALKVNQVGYVPNAGKKYAYLGLWLGPLGQLDVSSFNNIEFKLINAQTGLSVYTGTIHPRFDSSSPDLYGDIFSGSGEAIKPKLSGEMVYELDFSGFSTPGEYYFFVEGIGRSWGFRINNDVLGEAFYIHAKGLFHQRCGTPKAWPNTNWEVKGACHLGSYKGGFPPNISHLKKAAAGSTQADYRLRDEANNPIDLNHHGATGLIADTATEEFLSEAYGGWHDAADYDRRPFHLWVVQDLLAAYLMFPDNFLDGQLNIPESGNGLPDIIDEAAWGMDFWRRLQNDKGGLGTWVEATSHPQFMGPPDQDPQKYYTSLPTRESTAEYAAHAALLARIYYDLYLSDSKTTTLDRAKTFYLSAFRALNYALDVNNTVSHSWLHAVANAVGLKVLYQYLEPPTAIRKDMLFKTALNLYFLTKDPALKALLASSAQVGNVSVRDTLRNLKQSQWGVLESEAYLKNIVVENEGVSGAAESGFYQSLSQMYWTDMAYTFLEITLPDAKAEFPAYNAAFRDRFLGGLTGSGPQLIQNQNELDYRFTNYRKPTNYFWGSMGWGSSNALRTGKGLVVAYYLTRDAQYRNAALLLVDWHNGANPLGRSFTTGLGKVYPLQIQHIPSHADNILEPMMGITIYGVTGGISWTQTGLVNSLLYPPSQYTGLPQQRVVLIPKDLLPTGFSLEGTTDAEAYAKVGAVIAPAIPHWRRFSNVPDLEVPQNEFTIHETISPSIAFVGALMGPGWMPPTALKNRTPINDLEQFKNLPGYLPQP